MGRAHEVRAKAMAATAAKKSKLYSIYAKEIYQAAKGNPDPSSNDVLRRVIEKAKREQVPADVINRNIDKVKIYLKSRFPNAKIESTFDKIFLYSQENLHNERFIIGKNEYMISKRENNYEIRKLSNTFNANVIFSIELKSNKSGLSVSDFIFILIQD